MFQPICLQELSDTETSILRYLFDSLYFDLAFEGLELGFQADSFLKLNFSVQVQKGGFEGSPHKHFFEVYLHHKSVICSALHALLNHRVRSLIVPCDSELHELLRKTGPRHQIVFILARFEPLLHDCVDFHNRRLSHLYGVQHAFDHGPLLDVVACLEHRQEPIEVKSLLIFTKLGIHFLTDKFAELVRHKTPVKLVSSDKVEI